MASKFKPYFDKYCKPDSNAFERDLRKAVLVWLTTELHVNHIQPVLLSEMIDRELMFYPIITNEHGTTYIKHALIKALERLRGKWYLDSKIAMTLDMTRKQ